MTFSITDVAFEGFRVMRRAPVAVVMWGVTYLVCIGLVLLLGGAALASAAAGMSQAAYDPTAAVGAVGSVATVYLLAIPLMLIAAAIVVAATCRAVLTPDKPGFFYMRLGRAEFRLLGAYLIVAVGAIVAMICIAAVLALVVGGAIMAGASGGEPGMSPVGLALIYPIYFGLLILYVWIAVRLSLVGPITVAEGRFALGRSWQATKGRFWTLLDLGAATMVRWFLVYVVMIALLVALVAMTLGAVGPEGLVGMEPGSAAPWMTILPMVIGLVLLLAAFGAIQFTVLSTPFAAYYRDVIAATPVEADPAA